MNKINSHFNSYTPKYSDTNLSKNHSSSSNYLLTYTANNFYSNEYKYELSTKSYEKYYSLSNQKANLNNDGETQIIINKYIRDEKDDELMKILGNNKESLNTISNIQADDKNANLNTMITNNSDKEIVENLLNDEEMHDKNLKRDAKKINNNKNIKEKNAFFEVNYVNEKNIFKKSELLINKNKFSNKLNMDKFEFSSNTYRPSNYNKTIKDDNLNSNKPDQNKRLLFGNSDSKILPKDNTEKSSNNKQDIIIANSNKFSLTDFNKTLNKKNRYSLTSQPGIIDDILSKINVLENIEEKVLSVRESNEMRKSLTKIDEEMIETKKKNPLKKSITNKNSFCNSSNNKNKFSKLTQTKDFKSNKLNKKSNPFIKRNENTISTNKKFGLKRNSEATINSNGFITFQNANRHIKKFSILNSLSNSDSFTNTSMNFSSNNDSKRLKGICEEENYAYYDASQKNKFDLKKNIYLGIIDENLKNNSFNDVTNSRLPHDNEEGNIKNPPEPITNKKDKDKSLLINNSANSKNTNSLKKNEKKLNFDKKISNLRNEINNRLREINGISLNLDMPKSNPENNLNSQTTRNGNIYKNMEPNFDQRFNNINNNNNFNQIFESNIKQLEEKFANFKKKINVQQSNQNTKKYSTHENNLNLLIESKKEDIEEKNRLRKTSGFFSASHNKKQFESNYVENKNDVTNKFNLKNYLYDEVLEDNLDIKNTKDFPGELEKNINKITNYVKKNSMINGKRTDSYVKQINTDISNFEVELINTEMNYNKMLENLDTFENLNLVKTEVISSNQKINTEGKNANCQIDNDITLENIEDSCNFFFKLYKRKFNNF